MATRSGLVSPAETLSRRVRFRLRRRARRVRQALRVLPARLDPLARPVSRDSPDLQARLARRGSPALQGRPALRVQLVPLGLRVRKAPQVRLVRQARRASLVRRDLLVLASWDRVA
jgi:hypothetical protein